MYVIIVMQSFSSTLASNQQLVSEDTKGTQGMNNLLTSVETDMMKRSDHNSTSEGIFSEAMRKSKGKQIVTSPSVQGEEAKTTRRRGRPRKERGPPEKSSILPQAVIDHAARTQNVKSIDPVWIRLLAADNQLDSLNLLLYIRINKYLFDIEQ